MKKFIVEVSETLKRLVVVEEENEWGAVQKVTDAYTAGQVVLNADDYVDTDFSIHEYGGDNSVPGYVDASAFWNLDGGEEK